MDHELSFDEILSSHELTAGDVHDLAADDVPVGSGWRSRLDAAALLALVAALTAGVMLVLRPTAPNSSSTLPVTGSSSPVAALPRQVQGLACLMPGNSCVGDRLRVAGLLAVPVSFVPVAGLDTDDVSPGRWSVEVRRTDAGHVSGMTVMESPAPVEGTVEHRASALRGATAARVAGWLAALPFVAPTAPEKVSVGQVHGYRVAVRLRAGALLPGCTEDGAAGVTFVNHGGTGRGETTAVSPRLRTAYYYLLDVASHGLVVVWVWTWDGGSQDLAAVDSMVESLRWG